MKDKKKVLKIEQQQQQQKDTPWIPLAVVLNFLSASLGFARVFSQTPVYTLM